MSEKGLTLRQQKLIERREFIVEEFTLRTVQRMPGSLKERSILLEDLFPDRVVRGQRLEGLSFFLALAFLCGLGASLYTSNDPREKPNWIMASICLVASAGMASYCWIRSGHYVLVAVGDGDPVELFGDRPGIGEVDGFIAELSTVVREYSLQKYGVVTGLLPMDQQMQRLTWLRDRNYLGSQEYQDRVTKLQALFEKPQSGPIGFKRDGV